MAGQGTIALEIFEDVPDLEAILIPIGGGGLISGIVIALRLALPDVRIIGVEPEGAASMRTSREKGSATQLERVTTIADGLATKGTES